MNNNPDRLAIVMVQWNTLTRKMDELGIDPSTSCMLNTRSTI